MRDSMDGVAPDQGRCSDPMSRSGSGSGRASFRSRQTELPANRPPGSVRGRSVVRRDGRPGAGRNRPGAFARFALTLVAGLIGLGHAWGQAAGAAEASDQDAFTATWVPLESSVQQIDVGVGRSVRVQLSKPIVRAHAADEANVVVRVLSPVELLLTGKAPGTTQVIVWAEDERQLVFDVTVEINLDPLRKALVKVARSSKVSVEAVRGSILLTGTVRDPDTADRIVRIAELFAPDRIHNHLQVAGEYQVLLRVTVAEISRTATRQLGINGFLAGDNFQDMFLVNNIGGINPSNIGAAAGAAATGPIPFLLGGGGIPVGPNTTFSLGFPRIQMQLFLQALRENGLARILAEPTLTTISGQPAEFLAGGEFPIPVPQGGAGGATSITIDYREFGVRLQFTPTVLGSGRIRLMVRPEVSELDFTSAVNLTGFVVPGLSTRMVSTTVEVGNGQTIVIAGLLSDRIRANSTKIPGLGEMPVLGALFRSVRYQRNLTELVIMVTPEIVAPQNPDQVLPIPGNDLMDPDDWELFGLGVLERGQSGYASGLLPPAVMLPAGDGAATGQLATERSEGEAETTQSGSPAAEPAEDDARRAILVPASSTAGPGGDESTRAGAGRASVRPARGPTLYGPWGPSSISEERANLPAGR